MVLQVKFDVWHGRSVLNPLGPQAADVTLYRDFLATAAADISFETLPRETEWKQESMRWCGKVVPMPRLTAWYGDEGREYSYSGINGPPKPWMSTLLGMKAAVEGTTGIEFNSVLLNNYRDGRDSVSRHSDHEAALGTNPVAASVSQGRWLASRV